MLRSTFPAGDIEIDLKGTCVVTNVCVLLLLECRRGLFDELISEITFSSKLHSSDCSKHTLLGL